MRMNRKDTQLLVENWRRLINEESDQESFKDGGVAESFDSKSLGNSESFEKAYIDFQHMNDQHKEGGRNSKKCSLTTRDIGKYEENDEGIFYVTKSGIWNIPDIKSSSVNTGNFLPRFIEHLQSNNFQPKQGYNQNPSGLK